MAVQIKRTTNRQNGTKVGLKFERRRKVCWELCVIPYQRSWSV